MRSIALAVSLLALSVAGCRACGDEGSATAPPPPPRSAAEGAVADRDVRRLFDHAARCDLEHRGVLVDFGTTMTDGRVSTPDSTPFETAEHDGATWSLMTERSSTTRFTLTEPGPIFVSARVQPHAATSVSFYVDDAHVGSARLRGSEARVVETSATDLPLDAGEHTLTMRFAPARSTNPYAEVDWLRVGFPDDSKITYGAPTLDAVLSADAVLGKVPHRAFSLLAPSVVRCPVRVPAGGRFRAALGMVGAGDAEAEVVVRADGEAPVVLGRAILKGGDDATWTDVDYSLDPFQGKVVALELRAPTGSKAGRVLFGDPEVTVPTVAPESGPPAQVVVVLVVSGVGREELPGYADRPPPYFERLRRLSERGTIFKEHRAPTTVVPGTLATLLSGLQPEAHTLTDYGARLPARVPTMIEAAQQAGYDVGWFTAVPYSTPAFGLPRSSGHVEIISPAQGEGADALAKATLWVESHLERSPEAKIFLFVHARGGHPPWAVDPKLVETLPPENYTGEISARRAAQQLAGVRGRRKLHQLPEADQTRLAGLYQLALFEQDRSLGALVDALDEANVADRTLLVVTGDGSPGLSQLFTQTPTLDDRTLALPLYVLFPGGAHSGRVVEQTSEVADVSRTLYDALRVGSPRAGAGRDLAHLAAGRAFADDEPMIAREGEAVSARWGRWVLSRTARGSSKLCDLLLDPTCTFDRRPQFPLTASAIERAVAARARETATIDDETLSALRVWGAMD